MIQSRTLELFGERPAPRPPAHKDDALRWYQYDARAAVLASLEQYRSTLLVLATGLGKTVVFSSIARHWKEGRVLVLAHREELVSQAARSLENMTGERVDIEQGELRSGLARIVVGSVQTCYRDNRLERLAKNGGFGLVIADEAHHYVSPTYRKVLDYFSKAKILGVTATPDRADARALGMIFESVAYSMDLQDGIEAGYLVPLRGREIEMTEVNLDTVSVSAGDLAAGELDEKVLMGVEGIVKGMLQHSGSRQGLIFFPGVHSAHVAAARFNAIKPGSAVCVDGKTDKLERKRVMAEYKEGKFQFLTNCMVATEGFDAPTASVIGIARPTKSRSLYAQMVGRGTRVLPGLVESIEGKHLADDRRAAIAKSDKDHCLLIDFVGIGTRHTLATPEDLLGGIFDNAERKLARKIRQDSAEPMDVTESLETARNDLQKQRMMAAAKGIHSRVSAISRDFDPFKALGVSREREDEFTAEFGYRPMSPNQRSFLQKSGFSDKALDETSARSASKLIGEIIDRKNKGLISHKQAAMLHRYGVSDMKLSSSSASAAIDYVRRNKQPDPNVLRELVSREDF